MMCKFKGCDLSEMVNIKWYDNTSVTIIDYENDEYSVILEGDASHLSREMSTIHNQEWWITYEKEFEKRQE